jgi:hypothetical protein
MARHALRLARHLHQERTRKQRMNKRIVDAILEPYKLSGWRMAEMPDDMKVKLLCYFTLGDLRELAAQQKAEPLGSGVPGDGA